MNLRAPHYTLEVVEHLLGHAGLVKLNHHELLQVMAWFGTPHEQALIHPAAMRWLSERFSLQAVCVTCGAEGTLLWAGGQHYTAPGLPVMVRDTIGNAMPFWRRGWLTQHELGTALRFACAAGALVATAPGFSAADVTAVLGKPSA